MDAKSWKNSESTREDEQKHFQIQTILALSDFLILTRRPSARRAGPENKRNVSPGCKPDSAL